VRPMALDEKVAARLGVGRAAARAAMAAVVLAAASGATTGFEVSAFSRYDSANRSSRPESTSPRFHTSARLASMSGIWNRPPDSV